MMPPRCEVCHRDFDCSRHGGLVYFADYEPLPDGVTGHPRGAVWFCRRHVRAARRLTRLSSGDAVARIRRWGPLAGVWGG